MSDLRVVFMGTPNFSVMALNNLIANKYNIVGVYSQPPRPAGRGHKLKLSAVHQCAENNNITVFTPKNFKSTEAIEEFKNLKADIAVVVAYGLILPEAILNTPKYGCLNIHASLLPRWRGAAPIQRAIIAGDNKTGICIMQMDKGLDTGDVIIRKETPITLETTATSLHDTLAEMGAEMIVEVLDSYKNNNKPKAIPQTGDTCYAGMLSREEGKIDWSDSAENIERKIRALTPWPSVYCTYNNGKKRLKVHNAEIVQLDKTIEPATIIAKNLTIACGSNALLLTSVQPEGKKPMNGQDFFNGSNYKINDIIL